MFEKKNKMRIEGLFFENPSSIYSIREIARMLHLSPSNVHSIINELLKEKVITKRKRGNMTELKANLTETFISLKRTYNLYRLLTEGLVNFLVENYDHPESIVLFGSFSRGEDTETSDIDIAIMTTKHKTPSLSAYEKKLKRKINIHEITLKKISDEFLNNLCNGIVLYGYLRIK